MFLSISSLIQHKEHFIDYVAQFSLSIFAEVGRFAKVYELGSVQGSFCAQAGLGEEAIFGLCGLFGGVSLLIDSFRCVPMLGLQTAWLLAHGISRTAQCTGYKAHTPPPPLSKNVIVCGMGGILAALLPFLLDSLCS
jgi:hypothetical protein